MAKYRIINENFDLKTANEKSGGFTNTAVLIGGLCRKERRENGYTLKELSEKTGVSVAKLTYVEQCEKNISLKTICKLLDIFGYKIEIHKK